MAEQQNTTVGYLAPYSSGGGFFDNVRPLVPESVNLEIEALDLVGGAAHLCAGQGSARAGKSPAHR